MMGLLSTKRTGFSFIEILIVVLVVGVLAAIVAPNYMNMGRGRSTVSRVKSDQRSLATAIEAYYVDNNAYPAMENGELGAMSVIPTAGEGAMKVCTFRLRGNTDLATITTPISYITSYFSDAFATSRGTTFGYRQFAFTWILTSYGPDRDENGENPGDHRNTNCVNEIEDGVDWNFEPAFNLGMAQPNETYLTSVGVLSKNALIYDPTNGTTSEGDVVRIKQ